jgi:hypothetical protein
MGADDKKRLEELRPGTAVVTLTHSRWDAFKKTFPNAKGLEEVLQELINEIIGGLTEEDLTFLSVNHYTRNVLLQLDPSRIDDPMLSNIIGFVKSRDGSDRAKRYFTWHSINNGVTTGIIKNIYATTDKDALANYPLVSGLQRQDVEDAYCYINAKYATLNK